LSGKDTAFDLWQLSHPIKNKGPTRVLQHWKRPLPGWTKCNVDASFIAEEGHGATGMVLRDEGGEFAGEERGGMTTASMLCPRKRRPAVMESSSPWTEECSVWCQVLVNLWEQRRHQSEVGPLLQQIEDLSRSLDDFSLIRSCNSLARECTKLVSHSHPVEEWLVPPSGLWGIIENNCSQVHDQ
jgi:hypothetical protein